MCARELGDIWGTVVRDGNDPADSENIKVTIGKVHDGWGSEIEMDSLTELFQEYKPGQPLEVGFMNVDIPATTCHYYQRGGKKLSFAGQGKFARLASAKMAQLLPNGAPVVLEFDVYKTGDHGQPLAYVFTAGRNEKKGNCINIEMVRSGLALPYIIPPNHRYADQLRQAGREAYEKQAGMLPFLVYDRYITDPAELDAGEVLNEPFIYRLLTPYIMCPGEMCPAFPRIDGENMRWLVDIKATCYYNHEAYAYIPAYERTWYPYSADMKAFGFKAGRTDIGKCICGDMSGPEPMDSMLTYTPFGAACQVTGSKHFFEIKSAGIARGLLVDCGLNYDTPASAAEIAQLASRTNYIIITHAHLDHVGDLARLLLHNQHVEIFLTYGTHHIIMETGKRQVNGHWEAIYKKYRDQFRIQPYHRCFKIADGIRAQFYGAGHMPGAAQVSIEFSLANGKKRQVFITGDLGPRYDIPILMPPENEVPSSPDLMICESTYGTDEKKPVRDSMMYLLDHVEYARLNRKKIICAAFSAMRTQSILLDFWKLKRAGLLAADYKVVLKATQHSSSVKLNKYIAAWLTGRFLLPRDLDFAGYPVEIFDPATAWQLKGENPFTECVCTDSIWADQADFMIVADGMWNFGKAREVLIAHAGDEDRIFLLAGFQAGDSNGGQLQVAMDSRRDKAEPPTAPRDIIVKEWNWEYEVTGEQPFVLRAEVRRLEGYMGHIDNPGRAAYIGKIRPRRLMLIHGDEKALYRAEEQLGREFPEIKIEIPRKAKTYSI